MFFKKYKHGKKLNMNFSPEDKSAKYPASQMWKDMDELPNQTTNELAKAPLS